MNAIHTREDNPTTELEDTKEALRRCRNLLASERELNERLSKQDLVNVTRLEVIDSSGRAYTNYTASNIKLSLQDNWMTLKIFTRR